MTNLSASVFVPSLPERTPFSPDALRLISEEVGRSFRDTLESTRLVLLDVDPYCIHAYWNLNHNDVSRARARLGRKDAEAPLVLRFHAVGEPGTAGLAPGESFDVEVQGLHNRSYFGFLWSAPSCWAEIGLRAADGRFLVLARSESLTVPPVGWTGRQEEGGAAAAWEADPAAAEERGGPAVAGGPGCGPAQPGRGPGVLFRYGRIPGSLASFRGRAHRPERQG